MNEFQTHETYAKSTLKILIEEIVMSGLVSFNLASLDFSLSSKSFSIIPIRVTLGVTLFFSVNEYG